MAEAPESPSEPPDSGLFLRSVKIYKAGCDSTAGKASVPTALYDTGPSHQTQPGTREQLLDEKLWQLSFSGRGRSRWEWTAGNVIATSGTLRPTRDG